MRGIKVRILRSDSDERTLQKAYEFCQSLTEDNTNGFEWPKALRRAHDLSDFKRQLDVLKLKEEFDLKEFQEKGYVPQTIFWANDLAANSIIGMAKVRLLLTPKMLRYGGHIGLGLREDFRGLGKGSAFLNWLLDYCSEQGLHDILLTADANNFASRRMIEKCGGQMWDIIRRDDGQIARYWIHQE